MQRSILYLNGRAFQRARDQGMAWSQGYHLREMSNPAEV